MSSKKAGDCQKKNVPLLSGSCRTNEPSACALAAAGASHHPVSCTYDTAHNGDLCDVHETSVDESSAIELLHCSVCMDNNGVVSMASSLESNANSFQSVVGIQDTVVEQHLNCLGFKLNSVDTASVAHSEQNLNGAEPVEHSSKVVNGMNGQNRSDVHNCGGDCNRLLVNSESTHSEFLQAHESDLVGAVGGYVNGFLSAKEHRDSELNDISAAAEVTQGTCSNNAAVAGCFTLCDRVINNDDESRDRYDFSEQYKMAKLDSVTCGAEAAGFTNLCDSSGAAESDFCLDDYIDADMHLSPVAGSLSLSSSSSSLSDVAGVAATEQDCDRQLKTVCNDLARNSSCLPLSDAGCLNGLAKQSHSDRLTSNGELSPNGSLADVSLASRGRANVAQMLQSSGHPSSSSFDSLPASLPSPCGNFTDSGEASSLLHEDFLFGDVPLPQDSHMADCLLNSEKTVDSNSCVLQHKMNESYWLSMSGNSDLDSPDSEHKACSNVTTHCRLESTSHLCDEVALSMLPYDACDGAAGGLLLGSVNGSSQEHFSIDKEAVMNNMSVSSEYFKCLDSANIHISNNGISKLCKTCLKHHKSTETIALPHNSLSDGTFFDLVVSNGDELPDRNSNNFGDSYEEPASARHLALRLSTSLTLLVLVSV